MKEAVIKALLPKDTEKPKLGGDVSAFIFITSQKGAEKLNLLSKRVGSSTVKNAYLPFIWWSLKENACMLVCGPK